MSAATCTRCGSIAPLTAWRGFTRWRGRLFFSSPSSTSVMICKECVGERIDQSYALGFDIHTHTWNVTCTPSCGAKVDGRSHQRQLMQYATFNSKYAFRLIKVVDDLPKINALVPLETLRYSRFFAQWPQEIYEAVPTLEQLVGQLSFNAKLESYGVPLYARRRHTLTFEVFEAAHHSTTGVIAHPQAGEPTLGLHTVAVTGVSEDGETIHFKNNWGATWGNYGYGTVSIEYLRICLSGIWTFWNARYGLHPYKLTLGSGGTNATNRARWMIENPVITYRLKSYPGDSWKVDIYESTSLADYSTVQCVQLRNGYGLRMGWAYIRHLEDKPLSIIEEIFVIPAFRQQGIGSYLEAACCELAESVNSVELQLFHHAADAMIVGTPPRRKVAREFGTKRGYEWRYRSRVHPPLYAVGFQKLSTPRPTSLLALVGSKDEI